MGEVILGMPGPWAEDVYEASDHYTTKFGGLPDWPIPNMVIPHNLRVCTSCGTSLLLVAQIYAPVSTKTLTIEEFQIFIFGCASAVCEEKPESWIAVRVQRYSRSRTSGSLLEKRVCSYLMLLVKLQMLIGGTTFSPSTKGMMMMKIYLPCFYVYILEEALQKDVASICLRQLSIKDNQEYLDVSASQETWDEEAYEYDRALSASRTCLKFKKRIDVHPEQCFRYTYGGKPLLAAEELRHPGRCELCGGSRHYEMQLTPPLLYFLQQATRNQNYTLENWNWLTLLIYTCSDASFHYHYAFKLKL